MKIKIFLNLLLILFILSCTDNSTNPDNTLKAPSNLNITQINTTSIQLSWQDNNSDEEGFRIDRKIGENEWEENYQLLSDDTESFIDSNLVIIANYSYRVRAFIGEEYSDPIEANHNFFYNDIHSISPNFSGQIDLGLNESFEVSVILRDSLENIVQRNYNVWFKLITNPEGMNINNVLFNNTDSISVQSVDGIASVTLQAGNQSGSAAIKAYTYNSLNEEISIVKSNIVVHSGQPEVIEISIGGNDSGEDLSSGNWGIEVSAMITDINGNPVDYGIAVWFSLEDPDNPGLSPTWASIQSETYVGNENANGDSVAGVAFTQLSYEGSHTNDELIIWVEVSWPTVFTDSTLVSMPMQFGNLDVTATPSHLEWFTPSGPDSLIITLAVLLQDGQSSPIDNQQIIFSCDLGIPIDLGTDNDNNPFTENTGILPNQPGQVPKEWIFYRDECPPPVGNEPGMITVIMYISVPGTSLETEFPITLIRYP